jgi:uncharacterized protein (DUF3084 family)
MSELEDLKEEVETLREQVEMAEQRAWDAKIENAELRAKLEVARKALRSMDCGICDCCEQKASKALREIDK